MSPRLQTGVKKTKYSRYHGALQVALVVKNPPANGKMSEIQVYPWVGKYPLEKGMAIHSTILSWRLPMGREAREGTLHGFSKSWTLLDNLACSRQDIFGKNSESKSFQQPKAPR